MAFIIVLLLCKICRVFRSKIRNWWLVLVVHS